MGKLDKKIAIVTGGGKGIGEAVCKVLAKKGAIIHLIDIDAKNGDRVSRYINKNIGICYFHQCDLTEHEKVGTIFRQIYKGFGSIDILVNNAAIAHIGNVETTLPEDMDRIFAVNVKSVYSCLHFGVKYMKKSGGGAIVNMASIASLVGISDRFAYSMSKGAIYALTFSIAKDYLNENIRCNSIGPARVHTPFVDNFISKNYPGKEKEMFEKLSASQPIGRMGKPKEVANLVAYLCSKKADFITGSFFPIDGGFLTLNS